MRRCTAFASRQTLHAVRRASTTAFAASVSSSSPSADFTFQAASSPSTRFESSINTTLSLKAAQPSGSALSVSGFLDRTLYGTWDDDGV